MLRYTGDEAIKSDFEQAEDSVEITAITEKAVFRAIACTPGTTPEIAKNRKGQFFQTGYCRVAKLIK